MNENSDKDRLYCDPDLAQFYDLENEWAADQEYCAGLAREAGSVLDLGCGTGLFLARLGGGKNLVGADPAAAMLEIARARPGGDKVTWVEADARELGLGERFELIVLTGHAFQVFLTDDDRRAVLQTIAAHLTPQGRFIFDTRNPRVEDWRTWSPEETQRQLEHPQLGAVDAWTDVTQDIATGVVTYQTHYRIQATGRHFTADSKIAFPPKEKLEALMLDAGLTVDTWLGDWHGAPYDEASADIIPVGRLG